MADSHPTQTEKEKIRALSDRLVTLQKPIRILDAIKWDESIKEDFFKNNFEKIFFN